MSGLGQPKQVRTECLGGASTFKKMRLRLLQHLLLHLLQGLMSCKMRGLGIKVLARVVQVLWGRDPTVPGPEASVTGRVDPMKHGGQGLV